MDFRFTTKHRKIKGLLISALLVIFSEVFAQQGITINGTIIDESNQPLIGAAIQIKGTSSGLTSDMDGKFTLTVPSTNSVLVISYLGYETQEIRVGNNRNFTIRLKTDAQMLDETVVVGYGRQKKINLTGSVAAVSAKEITKVPAGNISNLVVGKLPGLVSSQAGGAPGADGTTLMVRGYTSFSGNSMPLVLVDGVEREMDRIDPNDIESITVLKDAASAAVYGLKAANGVILVTTKRGEEGKATVTYRGNVSFQKATTMPKMMNGVQYMQYYNLARYLDGTDTADNPFFTAEDIAAVTNGDPTDGYEDTDWTSSIFNIAPMHQHNLSVTGGNKSVKYFISGGFMDQRGFYHDYKFQRGNFRSNIDAQATKDIKVTLNLSGRMQNSYRPGAHSYNNQDYGNVVGDLLYAAPFIPKEYNGLPTSAYRAGVNPDYARKHSGFQESKNFYLETSAKIEYSAPFLKGLKASFLVSWDHMNGDGTTFSYAYKVNHYNHGTKQYTEQYSLGLSEDGNMYVGHQRSQQVLLRPQIEYANKFGKHDVGALFLYEQTQYNYNSLSGSRQNFPIFDLPYLDFGNEWTEGASSSATRNATAGYVGRVNYGYDSKYLAEFSFRYDGSYNFAPGHRWGFFPSLSLGWVVSNEQFFKDALPKIDVFKIRASAGKLGRDNVDEFLYRKYYMWQEKNSAFGMDPTAANTLYNGNSYPNPDLTWEKTNTFNAGFDLTAWNGLLGAEFDVFYKYTYDILQGISASYPPSLGGHVPTTDNSGRFDAKGFELVLRHTNRINDFSYNISGNVSFTRNRILSKTESSNVLPWQSVIGTSMGAILGYEAIGLIQTEEQLANAPTPISGSRELRLGDILYRDLNGDGKITTDDATWISNSNIPEMMFALNFDANYKGFDLSLQFQGAALNDKMLCGTWNNGASDNTPLTKPFYGNYDNAPVYLVEGSWTPDNTDAEYPRLSVIGNPNNSIVSTFWKRNGAYLRLKNITLGYTIPKHIINKAGLQNLRVYVAGSNLFTITDFKYLDPESPNVVQGYYPQQKTMSFGVDISF